MSNSRKPISQKQFAANCANASHSTGPRTPEGKARSSNAWPLFLRYKVLTEREYRRALEDFDRLKALRHELPNEPISDTQL